MTSIADDRLYDFTDRVGGVVVLITGGAKGIGKATAEEFARRGANIVIGDLDEKAAKETAEGIRKAGGQALARRCDVTSWDDQVALFTAAQSQFGTVDVVIANAGVTEIGTFGKLEFSPDGRPLPPNLTTVDINLTAVAYTTHLGIHHMQRSRSPLKALILLGSMASWQAMVGGPLYSASKHGVLGMMRALYPELKALKIRVAVITPWFAATNIVAGNTFLDGLPMTPVPRIAGAIFRAVTDPDWATSGSVWMLPDDRHLLLVERERFKEGVYKMIDDKLKQAYKEEKAKL